jgi:hypothetical protein
MRVSNSEHTKRPWRIKEIAFDFDLEDVWEVQAPGRPDDVKRAVELLTAQDPSQGSSRVARALWATRWKLGELFGWDDEDKQVGARVPSLRDRLPADLRDTPRPEFEALPFSSLYLLDDEFAAEIANSTVHGVMHMGFVNDEPGGPRGQMAVYVKPNGTFGKAYMAAIRPFRHLVVYPPMTREFERSWRNRSD